MRLKQGLVTQEIGGVQFLVAVGGKGFKGMVRSNRTAAFIVDRLQEETSEEAIVDAMCAVYDAPRDQIAADVGEILNTLRRIGALED